MAVRISEQEIAVRRKSVLDAARWCFLNFGYAKTSLDDIAKRAAISRTLLYRTFKDKEDIYRAVFADWLLSREPLGTEAVQAATGIQERLQAGCRVLVQEPWAEMVNAPMSGEFFEVCERLDPETAAQHRQFIEALFAEILDDPALAEVFVLSLDGLLADVPTVEALERRVDLLVTRFSPLNQGEK